MIHTKEQRIRDAKQQLEKKLRTKQKTFDRDSIKRALKSFEEKLPRDFQEVIYYLHSKTYMPMMDLGVTNEEVAKMVWSKQGIQLIIDEIFEMLGEKEDV